MKSHLAISSIVLAIVGASSGDAKAQTIVYGRIGNDDYSSTITSKAFGRAPRWNSEDENPPLSARKATNLATEKKDRFFGAKAKFWVFDALSLKRYGEHWYWVAKYVPSTGDKTGRQKLCVVVLMDGTVIEPKAADGRDWKRLWDEEEKNKAPAP